MTDEIAIKHGKYFYKELDVPEKVKIIQLVVYDVWLNELTISG